MLDKHLLKAFFPLIKNALPKLDETILKYKEEKLEPKLEKGQDVGILLVESNKKLYITFPIISDNQIVKLMEVEGYKAILLTEFINNLVNIAKNGH